MKIEKEVESWHYILPIIFAVLGVIGLIWVITSHWTSTAQIKPIDVECMIDFDQLEPLKQECYENKK